MARFPLRSGFEMRRLACPACSVPRYPTDKNSLIYQLGLESVGLLRHDRRPARMSGSLGNRRPLPSFVFAVSQNRWKELETAGEFEVGPGRQQVAGASCRGTVPLHSPVPLTGKIDTSHSQLAGLSVLYASDTRILRARRAETCPISSGAVYQSLLALARS